MPKQSDSRANPSFTPTLLYYISYNKIANLTKTPALVDWPRYDSRSCRGMGTRDLQRISKKCSSFSMDFCSVIVFFIFRSAQHVSSNRKSRGVFFKCFGQCPALNSCSLMECHVNCSRPPRQPSLTRTWIQVVSGRSKMVRC